MRHNIRCDFDIKTVHIIKARRSNLNMINKKSIKAKRETNNLNLARILKDL